MPKLASYYLPGLYIEDHAVDVPLDWRGHEPAQLAADGLPDSERIQLFYRTVCTPENVGRDLPLLVFLQGGPGGAGPRLLSPTSDGWSEEATRHFRVTSSPRASPSLPAAPGPRWARATAAGSPSPT